MTQEQVNRLRDGAMQSLHPEETKEIADLEAAEGVARKALELARERIAQRADLRQDPDGAWRHTSEPSPAAAA